MFLLIQLMKFRTKVISSNFYEGKVISAVVRKSCWDGASFFFTGKLFMIPQRFRFLLRVSDFNDVDNDPAFLLSAFNIFHTFLLCLLVTLNRYIFAG